MHSLYLSYDGMTDQLGQSQVIPYLQKLSENGIKFTLISFEKSFALEKNQTEVQRKLNESNIRWIPLVYHKSPPVLSTIWDTFLMKRKAMSLIKSEKIKVVHCRSYITALVGYSLKKQFGTRFIFDMRGFWADERVEGKIWNLNNPVFRVIYRYFKQREKRLLMAADAVITLTNKAKEIIQLWQLPLKASIMVIPCCADTDHFNFNKIDEANQDTLRKRLGLVDRPFVLGYLGAIGTWYMLDEMLDFFKILLRSNHSARFLFVTNETPETIMQAAIKRNIPGDSIIITHASRKDVPLYISLMNISVFFIKPTFSKKGSSPTKMAELLAMGIPVICNTGVGDDDQIIEQSGTGILCHQLNDEGYENAISEIENLLQKERKEIRATAIENYSLKKGAASYLNVYNNLIK